MPLTTPNYMMYLPDVREKGWGPKVNQNFATTDAELKRLATATVAINVALSSIVSNAALQAALAGKANVSHSHGITEIVGLLDELNNLKARVLYLEQHPGTGGTTPVSAGVITANFTSTARADNRTFDFAATATSASGSTINSYQWTFGDGTTSTGQTTSHLFTGSGIFHLSLRVTAVDGGIGTVQHDITVAGPEVLPPNGYGLSNSLTSTDASMVNLTFSNLNFGGGATPVTTRLTFSIAVPRGSYAPGIFTYINGAQFTPVFDDLTALTNRDISLNLPNYSGQPIVFSFKSVANNSTGNVPGEPNYIQSVTILNTALHFTY